MKSVLKWLSIGVGSLLGLVLIGGPIYQTIAESRDLARYPAPGRLFAVDGRLMHLYCLGQGSPTVVLEQGLSGVATAWGELHAKLTLTTRVCAYDRAGLGYSEPVGRPLRAAAVAERLHRLLRGAGIDDELVLVGWSAGGLYVREYYRRYPERVGAMLLIESSHEQQTRRYPEPPEENGDAMLRVARFLAPLGLVRLSGLVKARFAGYDGPEESRARLIAIYEQSHVVAAILREFEAFELDTVGPPPASLGDLPLIVISEGGPAASPELDDRAMADYLRQRRTVVDELQRELVALSSRGRQIIATESGHSGHSDQPELVIDAVEELVRTVRGERM